MAISIAARPAPLPPVLVAMGIAVVFFQVAPTAMGWSGRVDGIAETAARTSEASSSGALRTVADPLGAIRSCILCPCIARLAVSDGIALPIRQELSATESVTAVTVAPLRSLASTMMCERSNNELYIVIVVSESPTWVVPLISTVCSNRV
jgi:hypothetical protein